MVVQLLGFHCGVSTWCTTRISPLQPADCILCVLLVTTAAAAAGVPTGTPLSDPPLISAISEDPVLRETKMIAEAWDCDGLYQVTAAAAAAFAMCLCAIAPHQTRLVLQTSLSYAVQSRSAWRTLVRPLHAKLRSAYTCHVTCHITCHCNTSMLQVGAFPHYGGRWSEWNGTYRDTVRQFLKGTEGPWAGNFASALCGSPNIYANTHPAETDW
jgi:isoamylase